MPKIIKNILLLWAVDGKSHCFTTKGLTEAAAAGHSVGMILTAYVPVSEPQKRILESPPRGRRP